MKKEAIILVLLIIIACGIFILDLQQRLTVCVLENCHGMEIQCGPSPPDACTAMYAIGDKCLQYARCRMRDGRCQQMENPEFMQCKSCVQECIDKNENNMDLFECENKC